MEQAERPAPPHVAGSDVEARRRRVRPLLRASNGHGGQLQELHRRRATEERELASHGATGRAGRPHQTAERCEMMASLGAVAFDDELHLVLTAHQVKKDERASVLPPRCQAPLHDGGGVRALTGCQPAVGSDEQRDGWIVGGLTSLLHAYRARSRAALARFRLQAEVLSSGR